MGQAVMILTTVPSQEEAESLSQKLLERELVACVQIISGVESHYRWKGQVEKSMECLLLCKTLHSLQTETMEAIRGEHSYEVPEILAFASTDGLPAYLDWMRNSVRL